MDETTALSDRKVYSIYNPSLAGAMAYSMARHGAWTTGDMAELRRLNPEQPIVAGFWRLMDNNADHKFAKPHQIAVWARIVRCIAKAVKIGDVATTGPHLGKNRLGTVLQETGYSETRLKALLNSQGETTLRAVEHAALFLNSKEQSKYNWNQCAALMLSEFRDEQTRNNDRFKIAGEYYQTQKRSVD